MFAFEAVMQCGSCSNDFSKYRCPKCNIRSCSLDCVKTHKNSSGCNGERLFSSALSSDADLLTDVRFLESIDSEIIKSVKQNYEEVSRSNFATKWSSNQRSLFNACRQRSIELKLCPVPTSLRKENTSKATGNGKKLWWKLTIKIPEIAFTFDIDSVLDFGIVEETITKLYSEKSSCLIGSVSNRNDLNVYVQNLRVPTGYNRFFKLDASLSWREALKGTKVVEHPIIFLATTEYFAQQKWFEDDLHNQMNPLKRDQSSDSSGSSSDSSDTSDSSDVESEHSTKDAIPQNEKLESTKITPAAHRDVSPAAKSIKYDFHNTDDW